MPVSDSTTDHAAPLLTGLVEITVLPQELVENVLVVYTGRVISSSLHSIEEPLSIHSMNFGLEVLYSPLSKSL